MTYDYDLFVIGGGSGGVRAARLASDVAGRRVGLAEDSRLGGTCVIRGCVPKKLMVFASEFGPGFADARAYGWEVEGEPRFRWAPFHARLREELDRLEGVYRSLLEGSGVIVHDARATIAGPHEVRLSTGGSVSAEHILVATGGRPSMPPIEGVEHGLSSDDMFLLDELPGELLIIGGGYIGCEFACMMNGMGVDVTLYARGDQILRGFDDEARGLIANGMRERGVDVHTRTEIVHLGRRGDGRLHTRSAAGVERAFDAVLFATGRDPSSEGLGLEEAGVALGRGGEIAVDRFSRTSVPSIWAIGDVTDRIQLTPVAIREAAAFVATAFQGRPTPPDHDLVPSAVFTQPEMGSVGLSEEEAREDRDVEIYAASFRPMRTAFVERPDRVLMKLVVDAADRRVLGCHIVGPQAAETIQLAAVAIKMGATKEDFDRTCAVHPTISEEMVTMREPVRTVSRASGGEGRVRTA